MNKGSLVRKAGIAAIATLTAFAGLAPFAPGASAAANYTQTRFAGSDRFDTSALIASAIAEATPTAVLARADIFPDALTGSFAAAANGDGPLLLTRSDSVPARTLDALEDEGVDNVILLGGLAAIDASVESELEGLGYNVDRLQGESRYQTAVAIANDGSSIIGTIDGDRSALVSSGENFPDALSGAPLSFAAGLPSLLVPANLEDPDPGVVAALRAHLQDTIDGLNGLNIDSVYLLGGPVAVSQEIEDILTDEGFSVTRLQGGNRSATSVEVFEFGMDKNIFTNRRFGLARGDTFPDALSYAPLGGRSRATTAPDSGVPDTGGSSNGLLLAAANCTLSDDVESFLVANQATWTEGEILGGGQAICEEVADQVEEAASFGRAAVTLDTQSAAPGETITGNVQGENISSVFVSGCGIPEGTAPLTIDENGDFSVTIPATTQEDCVLTFETVFTDGSSEIDQFPIDIIAPGDPNVTLSPTSGLSGTQVTATFSGDRPGNITGVSSSNCTLSNTEQVPPSSTRTFNVAGADNTVCQITSAITFTDPEGGTTTLTDTFTISPAGGGVTPGGGVSSGTPLRTGAPDLLSTTIIDGAPNNGTQNSVRYTYDEPVVALGAGPTPNGQPTPYSIQGFDSNSRTDSTGVINIDPGDANSVIAQFSEAIDLRPFTIGTTDAGAATDGINPSVLASRALGGSTFSSAAGRTAAPDLLSVTTDQANQQITYTFDQPVQNAFATQFGYYTSSGSLNTGNSIVPLTGTQNHVTVAFGAPEGVGVGTDPVQSAVRHFVNDVTNAQRVTADGDSAVESGPAGVTVTIDNPVGHLGTVTERPDLTGAAKVSGQPSQVDFTLDETVNALAGTTVAANFAVYQDDGTRYDGTAVAQNGPTVVRVTFGPAGDLAGVGLNQNNIGQIVLAAVERGAINSSSETTQTNSEGAIALTTTGATSGLTDGPDLIGATFNPAANQVTFQFDEPVADVAPNGPPTGAEFFIVSAAGTTLNTGGAVTVSGNSVTVTFPANVAAAAGAGVESPTGSQEALADVFAANDFQGNANSPDSVGGGPAPG